MSEAEITLQLSEYVNRFWVMQQWWASISIGVLVMAHLASSRLNLLLICMSLAIYTLYTLYIRQMSDINFASMSALAEDLQALVDSGAVQSSNAIHQIQMVNTDTTLYTVTFGGTYLCVVAFLIYSYLKGRKSENA